ncbi:Golgi transport complex subunit 5-domain-containing protein [Auriculariales sp. MPI-PUGE-AT-0066]|nr:Golgi transport complex subunit 5-domain-containing protein [Auriculariales sp. MPI-PUGE-AT-0066]
MDGYTGATFDVHSHANALIGPSSKDDVSTALAKLNFGIDDVAGQLKQLVTLHHAALLAQAASVQHVERAVQLVRHGLDDVTLSLDKLRNRIRAPYTNLAALVQRLNRLQQATDVLRRTARFVILARRLSTQMSDIEKAPTSGSVLSPTTGGATALAEPSEDVKNFGVEGEKERTIAKAALSVAELVALLDEPDQPLEDDDQEAARIPLRSINAVSRHIPAIEVARARVSLEMESMVNAGLATLNQSVLSSSLQTAYNLHVLPLHIRSLVAELTESIDIRVRSAFDLARIAKDVNAKEPATTNSLVYRSRLRTEPTTLTAPQWSSALWARLETLIEEMAACCIKVYTLERVLKLKKDPVTQATFLDETLKLVENKPTWTFWQTLARSLEKHTKDASKNSSFLQQTLSSSYTRFLRLFHEFFAKIAVHTDTIYTQHQQSPETIVMLRSVTHFESLYLSRVTTRLNEAASSALSGVSRGNPPTVNDGVALARAYVNELDAARFDPLLVRGVAKIVGTTLEGTAARVDSLVAKDRNATTLLGPQATPQQVMNAQLVSFLYACENGLAKLHEEYPEQTTAFFSGSIKNLRKTYTRAADPLLQAIRREVSAVLARVHRLALGKGIDGGLPLTPGSSAYMKELIDKLGFIRSEPLAKFQVGNLLNEWVATIVKHAIRTFVLHVSIACPLGESGRMTLTNDMTELEYALDAFMRNPSAASKRSSVRQPQTGGLTTTPEVAAEYRTLRALRPLLFLETPQLAHTDDVRNGAQGIPPLIVLHHIIVRSPVPLPHTLHGWQEAEYVKWVEEHAPSEAWTLVEGSLVHYEKLHPGEDKDGAKQYIELAREVLRKARDDDSWS